MNHGTGSGTVGSPGSTSSGKFGNAATFNNVSFQYVQTGLDLLYGPLQQSNLTVFRWLYHDSYNGTNGCISYSESSSDGLGQAIETHDISNSNGGGTYSQTGPTYTNRFDCSGSNSTAFHSAVTLNSWYFKCDRITDITTTTPDYKLWYDTSTLTGSASEAFSTTAVAGHFRVGAVYVDNARDKAWSGYIDEVRVSSIARPDSWVDAEYNSTNAPQTFVIEGTPESPVVAGTPFTYIFWFPSL